MVTYNIIENSKEIPITEYEEFINLYNNPNISVKEIYKKLGWTTKKYCRLRKKALKEKRIHERQPRNRKPREKPKRKITNYTYNHHSRKFLVRKGKNYKMIHYGCYDTREQAEKIVEELRKCNWDKKQLKKIEKKVLNK